MNIRYKIWDWGGKTNQGSNVQYNVGVCTKAKRSLSNRYEIANEMLCLRLARALKLPVADGGVLEHDDAQWFASLEYSVAEESLPKVTDDDVAAIAANAWLTCGIIVFDSWIANEDRFKRNLLYDREKGQVYLIDHGRSFFCGPSPEKAKSELESLKDEPAITYNNHCLAKVITNLSDFPEWHKRLKEIPEYYIRESVEESVELGLPAEQKEFCINYLLMRRERLKALFSDRFTTIFPKLPEQRLIFDDPAPFVLEPGDFDFSI